MKQIFQGYEITPLMQINLFFRNVFKTSISTTNHLAVIKLMPLNWVKNPSNKLVKWGDLSQLGGLGKNTHFCLCIFQQKLKNIVLWITGTQSCYYWLPQPSPLFTLTSPPLLLCPSLLLHHPFSPHPHLLLPRFIPFQHPHPTSPVPHLPGSPSPLTLTSPLFHPLLNSPLASPWPSPSPSTSKPSNSDMTEAQTLILEAENERGWRRGERRGGKLGNVKSEWQAKSYKLEG